jgi:hypothetical protein
MGRRISNESESRLRRLVAFLCQVSAEICSIATGRPAQLSQGVPGRGSRVSFPAQAGILEARWLNSCKFVCPSLSIAREQDICLARDSATTIMTLNNADHVK